MRILITGGLGYVGSNTSVSLLNSGHNVGIIDNLSNTNITVHGTIQKITSQTVNFFMGDVCDLTFMNEVFAKFRPDAVIHCAGLKSIEMSILKPEQYYETNVGGTATLLNTIRKSNIKFLLFSSSASIYGPSGEMPVSETSFIAPANPYSRSKLMVEEMLQDFILSNSKIKVGILRYFNPVGAHRSGFLGDQALNNSDTLLSAICRATLSVNKKVKIYGHDYSTGDGSAVRDFIHISNLAESHIALLNYLDKSSGALIRGLTLNIGTGVGVSVLEFISGFEDHTGIKLNKELHSRRFGDIPISYARVSLAQKTIGWKALLGLNDIYRDTWNWLGMRGL